MRGDLIVLKFGGSVLRSPATLPRAVHEIHRWRRDGVRVVAVVSALAGRTDALLAECRSASESLSPHATAARVALGELESSALLGQQLDAAGIPAAVVVPAAIGLVATGDALDADPQEVDVERLDRLLAEHGVVIVPGFVAIDRSGRTVLLGRGGSDLSALFLAHALRARCRLVKDVDGLYEHDPSRPGPSPRRFERATWDDALETDGSIVQHKAIAFAKRRGLAFELGRIGGVAPTIVGGVERVSNARADEPRRTTVALLGRGTVGRGVLDALAAHPECFALLGVASRESRPDARALASSGADVVVECIGGTDEARALILAALSSGSHVVTANKAVLAAHGEELAAAAHAVGRELLSSAAVGGSAPVLERLRGGVRGGRVLHRLTGVLNGTTNFVLEALATGMELDLALEAARRRGLAERDASRDLEGHDAADKLAVLAAHAGFGGLAREDIATSSDSDGWASRSAKSGGRDHEAPRRRQVARLDRRNGIARAAVAIEALAADHPLHELSAEWNAVILEWEDGGVEVVRGRGAGGRPTAVAVLGDLFEIQMSEIHGRSASLDRAPAPLVLVSKVTDGAVP
jgi:homoserine dehydrogenase